jgi:coproporphyrinogen III oxidase-like Fe-S oxidoreductase
MFGESIAGNFDLHALNGFFPYTNVDLRYGMAGQQLEELDADLAAAMALWTMTIDVYPVNNLTPRASCILPSREPD